MIENISFLLGAGFSRPVGFPTSKEINEKLSRLMESDIMIHTNGTAKFLNGYPDPCKDIKKTDRLFAQEFIGFYVKEIINSASFDYEDFYDFYQGLLQKRATNEKFDSFISTFLKQTYICESPIDLLINFDITFNYLISDLLFSAQNELIAKYNCDQYQSTIQFLNLKRTNAIIHIHSLNHDLIFEYLIDQNRLQEYFEDGFMKTDSPYAGIAYIENKNTDTQLPYFKNDYKRNIRLYKLHGSIDYYLHRSEEGLYNLVKIDKSISTSAVLKKSTDENGLTTHEPYYGNFSPYFLTGKEEKRIRQSTDPIKLIYNRFIENMLNSKILIIIGYSFNDENINKPILDHFKQDHKSVMLQLEKE